MALDTVADYLNSARVLLQDTLAPYRYTDAELVNGLNLGLLEVRRLRPDLLKAYFRTAIPTYSALTPADAVSFEPGYRVALLYYICGQAQLRDDENTQDARATVFLNKFTSQMLTINA